MRQRSERQFGSKKERPFGALFLLCFLTDYDRICSYMSRKGVFVYEEGMAQHPFGGWQSGCCLSVRSFFVLESFYARNDGQ